jgi:hypothetical protein
MRRDELTEKILDIKRSKRWSWKHVAVYWSSVLCSVK